MKFKKRSLWPSCLGGASIRDAAAGERGSGAPTLKILTADGQVLRIPELWSLTAADLLAYTAHPHHMVCEGNPKDFLFHHHHHRSSSRLTNKLSSLDYDSCCDTESTSDRSDTNSWASPARRSFGSLTAAAAAGSRSGRRGRSRGGGGGGGVSGGLVGLSPLTRMPSFLGGGGGGDRKGLLGGFLASPVQRLRSFGGGAAATSSSTDSSSPWQRNSPAAESHHGYVGGGMSPLQMSRNAFSDMESDVGSEDGSCDFQVPRFERGRILPLDAELESGRVYYLVPMPRLFPDAATDSDRSLPWGPPCPAPKCSCLKASTAKRLQLESKKSSKHSRPALCASMRCNNSHGLMIMGTNNNNGSSKINPQQEPEWESEDFSGDVSSRRGGASTISGDSGELWREDSMRKRSASPFPGTRGGGSLPPHLGRFHNELSAYRTEEELLRDELAAKVARAQYRVPPAYCFRSPWKVELPIIIESMVAVAHTDKPARAKSSSSRAAKDGRRDSPRGTRSPEMMRWPPPQAGGYPHSPGLRSNRSPGRQSLSPGRRGRKSPVYPSLHSPHSSPSSVPGHSPVRYGGATSPHTTTRLLERQLSDSPLHLPATSPERFQAIPPKFQLSSPDKSSAPMRYAPPPHLQLSSPERSTFRHNNLNPPTFRQTHPAYTNNAATLRQPAADSYHRLSEASPAAAAAYRPPPPDVLQYYSEATSYHHRPGTDLDAVSSSEALSSCVPSQQAVQPWQSPPSGVNFCISGKTWQICSPQRSEGTQSPSFSGRPWKSVGSPGGGGGGSQYHHQVHSSSGPEPLGTGREPFTPTSSAWPNPAPRPQETGGIAREMLNAAQLGMVQQGSNGRFRSSPAWRDVRQITPGRPGGGQVGRTIPGHNGIMHRSSSPTYSGYGGPTW